MITIVRRCRLYILIPFERVSLMASPLTFDCTRRHLHQFQDKYAHQFPLWNYLCGFGCTTPPLNYLKV